MDDELSNIPSPYIFEKKIKQDIRDPSSLQSNDLDYIDYIANIEGKPMSNPSSPESNDLDHVAHMKEPTSIPSTECYEECPEEVISDAFETIPTYYVIQDEQMDNPNTVFYEECPGKIIGDTYAIGSNYFAMQEKAMNNQSSSEVSTDFLP